MFDFAMHTYIAIISIAKNIFATVDQQAGFNNFIETTISVFSL
jgi:hypothetical protein